MADYGRVYDIQQHALVSAEDAHGRVYDIQQHALVSAEGAHGRLYAIQIHVLLSDSATYTPNAQAKGRVGPTAEVPAGSKITVQGLDLTSTHGTPVSGNNDFKGNAGSKNAIVASMVSALNDAGNNFGSIVSGQALPADPEILEMIANITSFPGTGGNALTLTTNDAGNLALTAFAGGENGLQESVDITEALAGEQIAASGGGGVIQGMRLRRRNNIVGQRFKPWGGQRP